MENSRMTQFVMDVVDSLEDKSKLSIWEQSVLLEGRAILNEITPPEKTDRKEIDWGEEFSKCVRNPLYFYRTYCKRKV